MAIQTKWQNKTSFGVGDKVKISYRIIEKGKKERTQPFEGIVISIRGEGEKRTFTVRKIAVDNIGVERIFPLNSPWIIDLKVTKKPKKRVRRAKLYYLRKKAKKNKKRLL